MGRSLNALLVFSVFLLLQSPRAIGEGDGRPDVAYLDHFSDVIVVGTGSLESLNGESAVIEIEVARILKGKNIAQEIHIPLTIVSSFCAIARDSSPVNAIWFLRYLPDGNLTFGITPKSQSCQPFSNDYEVPSGSLSARWAYSSRLSPKEKLAYELAASLDAHKGTGPFVFAINQLALGSVEESVGADIYQKLAASPTTSVSMLGRLGLMRAGNPSQLRALSENLAALSDLSIPSSFAKGNRTIAISHSEGYGTYEFLLASSLASIANGTRSTVEELGKLLQTASSSERIRFGAARALRNVHTPLAVTFLAPLLWDQDPAMRAEAVGGLACFANNMPIIDSSKLSGGINLNLAGPYKSEATADHFTMGMQAISKNEAYYLSFWRAWWSTNGASVSASAKSST